MRNLPSHAISRTIAALAVGFMTMSATPSLAEKVLHRANDLSYGGKESLDPISPNRFYEVNDLIYSRLIRQDENGNPDPELALSWAANDTATEWTIKLRPGVKFTDGSDFGATDVKYSLERINDPALESPVADVLGIIDSVEVVDPLTVKVMLNTPHAGLPILLQDYRVRMLPEGATEPFGVGTGPFKLESFDAESTTELVANSGYWEGAPKLDRIEFVAIADSEARNQAMLGGQLDFSSMTRDQEPLYAGNPKFKVQSVPSGSWFGIAFLTDRAPLDDPRVRKAVRIAVDRKVMMTLLAGADAGAITCDIPIKQSDPFHAELTCPQDIEGAKKLLAEAGYPAGIDIDVHTADLEPGMVQYAEVFQQQVAPAGIRVTIVQDSADGYWDDVWMKENAVTSWGERQADQILNEAYRTDAGWNESRFANAAFDKELDAARSELDMAKAKQHYAKAQEILFEEGGTFIGYLENERRVMSANVSGISEKPEDYIRWNLIDIAQ